MAHFNIVPSVGISIFVKPTIERVISRPIAQDILLINVEKANGVIYGKYSLITSFITPVPDNIAVLVNSRSLKLRTCDLITLASQAQPKKASNIPRFTIF